jgi:hypothetical protein
MSTIHATELHDRVAAGELGPDEVFTEHEVVCEVVNRVGSKLWRIVTAVVALNTIFSLFLMYNLCFLPELYTCDACKGGYIPLIIFLGTSAVSVVGEQPTVRVR